MNSQSNQFEGRQAKLQEELAQRIPVRVLPIPGQNLADLSLVLPDPEVLHPEVLRREVLRRVPRHLHR